MTQSDDGINQVGPIGKWMKASQDGQETKIQVTEFDELLKMCYLGVQA